MKQIKKTKRTKKTKKSKSKFSIYKIIVFSLLFIIIGLSGFIIGYLTNQKQSNKEIKKYKNNLTLLEQKINNLSKELNTKKIPKKSIITPKTNFALIKPQSSEIEDLLSVTKNNHTIKQEKAPKAHTKKTHKHKKPQLVIIIDDVSFKNETKLIKQIPFHITPSFFPPTKRHPFTTVYAKTFSDYMVHVPMQAMHYPHPEPHTLKVTDNYPTIQKRINIIKKEFPRAKFINNHTGSRFTSNLQAMNKLFMALKKDHLGFVDSRTTPFTKASVVDKIYNIPMYSRNIFLDDKENPEYIRNQLKKAVKIAEKKGYAIAIGHPHKVTLITLKNAGNILKNVKVVYIDELNITKH